MPLEIWLQKSPSEVLWPTCDHIHQAVMMSWAFLSEVFGHWDHFLIAILVTFHTSIFTYNRLLWRYLTGSDLTHDDRKHLHGLPFAAVDFGSLPSARVRVEMDLCEADRWYRRSILRGGKGWFWGWEVGHLIQSLCWFPLYDGRQGRRQRGQRRQRGRGLLELTAGLDAVPQLGFARFLPAPQASEHAAVQQQHDGTGDEEGAHRGVQDVVIVLQFTLSGVAARHVVDAKYDGGRHRQSQDPSGRQQHGLSQVHMLPVVVEWYQHRDEPAAREKIKMAWKKANCSI